VWPKLETNITISIVELWNRLCSLWTNTGTNYVFYCTFCVL